MRLTFVLGFAGVYWLPRMDQPNTLQLAQSMKDPYVVEGRAMPMSHSQGFSAHSRRDAFGKASSTDIMQDMQVDVFCPVADRMSIVSTHTGEELQSTQGGAHLRMKHVRTLVDEHFGKENNHDQSSLLMTKNTVQTPVAVLIEQQRASKHVPAAVSTRELIGIRAGMESFLLRTGGGLLMFESSMDTGYAFDHAMQQLEGDIGAYVTMQSMPSEEKNTPNYGQLTSVTGLKFSLKDIPHGWQHVSKVDSQVNGFFLVERPRLGKLRNRVKLGGFGPQVREGLRCKVYTPAKDGSGKMHLIPFTSPYGGAKQGLKATNFLLGGELPSFDDGHYVYWEFETTVDRDAVIVECTLATPLSTLDPLHWSLQNMRDAHFVTAQADIPLYVSRKFGKSSAQSSSLADFERMPFLMDEQIEDAERERVRAALRTDKFRMGIRNEYKLTERDLAESLHRRFQLGEL